MSITSTHLNPMHRFKHAAFSLLFSSIALIMFVGHIPHGYAQNIEFQEFQSIPTHGANDWEFFTIDTNHYLAVANHHNYTYNTDSKLYQWNGTNFVDFQSIPTHGTFDWEFFTIGTNHYLVAANFSDSTHNI
jgi:hypothetical protein